MATIKNGTIVSFSNTPQAEDDAFTFYKDQLLSWNIFNQQSDVLSLDVMANDLGGSAKTLYSVDDGINYLTDLLKQDALVNGVSVWEAAGGDKIRIDNGKVDIDLSHSIYALTGSTDINAMRAGDRIVDTFDYAIRLGNGTLSWASVTIVVNGSNDAATISGNAAGTLQEDGGNSVTGNVTVTDADYGESHTRAVVNAASGAGLGTYSVDADGHWSYTVNNAAVQYLGNNQSTTDTFVVDSLDGTAHRTVTITIAGANDAAQMSGDASGTLTEDNSTPVTGTTSVFDPDSGQSHTQAVTNAASIGGLGTYSVDADGHWSYRLNNAAVQYLNSNQSTTDTFVVDSLDGTAHQTVTITITGADDANHVPADHISFATPVNYFGPGGVTISAADVNGDGKIDIVVGQVNSDTVSVRFGNGDGTFQNSSTYSTGSGPGGGNSALAVADLNGDGKADIVATGSATPFGPKGISVLLNNGDGTYGAPTVYSAGTNPTSVVVTDLNNDGKLDLIVGNYSDNTISVRLGIGDGTFGVASNTSTIGDPYHLAVGDLNGDGNMDVVTTFNHSDSVSVLLGNGHGGFGAATSYSANESAPVWVDISDLNNDGKPDVVVRSQSGVLTSVLMGNGDGTLQSGVTYQPGGFGGTVADLNGDGNPDIITLNDAAVSGNNGIGILQGNGDGTFQTYQHFAADNVNRVAAADVNGDGYIDLIGVNNGISVLLNTSFNEAATISGNAVGALTEDDLNPVTGTLTVTDPDQDQSHAKVITNAASIGGLGTYSVDANGHWSYTVNNASVQYLNNNQSTTDTFVVDSLDGTAHQTVTITINGVDDGGGNGLLTFSTTIVGSGALSNRVGVGDFNEDGKVDLVTSNGLPTSGISILIGEGNGAFHSPVVIGMGGEPDGVSVGDLNGDGHQDLAIANFYNGISILLGAGDGTFQAATNLATTWSPASVQMADFNGDGKLDIVEGSYGVGTVAVFIGNGDGSFINGHVYSTPSTVGGIAIGDLNGDGIKDMVAAVDVGQTSSVFLGNGDGTFQQFQYNTGGYSTGVALGDLNGDGALDAAFSNNSPSAGAPGSISIMLGDGHGSFGAPTIYQAGENLGSILMKDFNEDGKLDLAATNPVDGSILVFLGNGDGTVQAPTGYAAANSTLRGINSADVNGDGHVDLVGASQMGVSVLLNTTDWVLH